VSSWIQQTRFTPVLHLSTLQKYQVSNFASSQTDSIWRLKSTLAIQRLNFTPNNMTAQICSYNRTTKILLRVPSSLGFRNLSSQP
jgi:hypothetical protein